MVVANFKEASRQKPNTCKTSGPRVAENAIDDNANDVVVDDDASKLTKIHFRNDYL